jgi:F0F1-type ATP synthase membrane subunit a
MDSWSDSAGADETNDSSTTLVFGSCFSTVNSQGILTYIPLCVNPASDMNIMLIFCEDCILGTLISLIPILGFRTYAETIHKDMPLIFVPIFVTIEIAGQTMRILSISLRMAINVTAGHNLFFIVLHYIHAFIIFTVKFKYQLSGFFIITISLLLLGIDSVISSVQSYVIIVLETYYELDSE